MATETLSHSFHFDADHPVFPGHFPGHPVVPAALLLDRVTRLVSQHWPHTAGRLSLSQAKFLRPIGPQQAVELQLSWDNAGQPDRWRFSLLLDGQTAASGSLERLPDDPA